jgi:hypothetical protein
VISRKEYAITAGNPGEYIECAGRIVNSWKTLAFQIPYGIGTLSATTLGNSTGLSIYYPSGTSGEKTLTTWGSISSTDIACTDFGIRVVIVRSSAWISSYTSGCVTVVLHNLVLS